MYIVNGSCPGRHIKGRSITQRRRTLSSTAAWEGKEQANIQLNVINNRRCWGWEMRWIHPAHLCLTLTHTFWWFSSKVNLLWDTWNQSESPEDWQPLQESEGFWAGSRRKESSANEKADNTVERSVKVGIPLQKWGKLEELSWCRPSGPTSPIWLSLLLLLLLLLRLFSTPPLCFHTAPNNGSTAPLRDFR